MKKGLKFSEDYYKLPKEWNGTQAKLIAVYPEDIDKLKKSTPSFIKYDTQIREDKSYLTLKPRFYDLNFKDGLILMFIHYNSGIPFTTIRKNYKEKFEYYVNAIGENFILISTKKQGEEDKEG